MTKVRGASLIFLVVGIYGLIFSIDLSFGSWAYPGPKVLPFCLSIILVISGVLWLIYGKQEKGEVKAGINWLEIARHEATALRIIGITAGFIMILEPLGYLVASPLYLFALFFLVSRCKLWIAMGLAIGAAWGSFYFFGKVLSVQFPRGSFWF